MSREMKKLYWRWRLSVSPIATFLASISAQERGTEEYEKANGHTRDKVRLF